MLLCVALVAALSVTAFAADPAPTPNWEEPGPAFTRQGTATWDRTRATLASSNAEEAGLMAAALSEVQAAVKAYEAVKNNDETSIEEVGKAYRDMETALNNILADPDYATVLTTAGTAQTLAQWCTASNYSGMSTALPTVGYGIIPIQSSLNFNTSVTIGANRSAALRYQAAQTVLEAQYVLAVEYDMSGHTQMDWNKYIIKATAEEQALQTKNAKTAAENAKAGAISAQATAKSLINTAMVIAQNAAAEAVANAQATAYNDLAAAYATAVADFWADVSAEIATW